MPYKPITFFVAGIAGNQRHQINQPANTEKAIGEDVHQPYADFSQVEFVRTEQPQEEAQQQGNQPVLRARLFTGHIDFLHPHLRVGPGNLVVVNMDLLLCIRHRGVGIKLGFAIGTVAILPVAGAAAVGACHQNHLCIVLHPALLNR